MRSPFAIFRKNQKTLTVILVGLSMIAFVLLGAANDPNNLPAALAIMVVVAVCAGAAWIAGMPAKRSSEYGTWGAIIGLACGIMITLTGGPPDAVIADTGNISSEDLLELRRHRDFANQFVQRAVVETQPDRNQAEQLIRQNQFGFGIDGSLSSERDVVTTELLRREANRLGLTATDQSVTAFIKRITGDDEGGGAITRDQFREIRKQLGLSEDQLYEILRAELQARMAAEFLFDMPSTLPPEEYWEFYRRMYTRQTAQIAAVRVTDYVDDEAEPTPAELQEFFAAHRENYPNLTKDGLALDEGAPGFKQPRRVRIGFLEAVYDDVLATIPEPTEEEIEAYYEEHYKKPAEEAARRAPPQEGPAIPSTAAPSTESGSDTPSTDPETTPNDPADSSSQPGEPASESTPDNSPETPSEGATPEPGADSPECEIEQEPAEAQPGDESKPADDPQPADASATAENSTDDSSDTNQPDAQPTAEPAAAAADDSGETTPAVPPSNIPLLDAALREQIRLEIMQERAVAEQRKMAQAASDFLFENVGFYLNAGDDDPNKITLEQAEDKLLEYAAEHGLYYDVTPLLSSRELAESEDYPVGGASTDDGRRTPISTAVFQTGEKDLYRPVTAQNTVTDSWFACWKTEDEPTFVPDALTDERVREQVVEAWRQFEARPKARAQADQLAELVRDSEDSMDVVLGTQTTDKNPSGYLVIETGEFSWLSFPGAQRPNPWNFYPPQIQDPPGTADVGPEFMQVVFNQLGPGEVGVASNIDKSVYYVVKIGTRTPGTGDDFEGFRERFLAEPVFEQLFQFPSVYQQLAAQESNQYRSDWVEELWQRHGAQLTVRAE